MLGVKMKNMKWSQLNIILGIIVISAVLIAVYTGIASHSEKKKLDLKDAVPLSASWIIKSDGAYDQAVNLPCHLEANPGQEIEISQYLPETISEDYGIAFYSIYNRVCVMVEDEVVYRYGYDEKDPILHVPAPNWNVVSLSPRHAGKKLTIIQSSDYGKYAGLFMEVQGGGRSALLYQQWMHQGMSLISILVLIFLVLGLCLIAALLRIHRKLDFRFWYYLILSILTMGYIITGHPLFMVYNTNEYVVWTLHLMLRMIIPVVYLLFIRGFMPKRRLIQIVDTGIFLASLIYIVITILQIIGLVRLPVTYDAVGILYEIGYTAITVLVIMAYIKYRKNDLLLLSIANGIYLTAGIVNQFIKPNHLYQQMGTYFEICTVVYLFLLLGCVLQIVLAQVNDRMEAIENEYHSQREIAVTMLNPNFLFSSLNTLLTMTKEGSRLSAKMVFAFSKYLRYNLNSIRETSALIPFEEELGHITSYLSIQQLKMPEMKVIIEDKMHDFVVPIRSIEPIVENAVKYGIGKNDERGQIIVRSYERRDGYAIQIVDDGKGFDTDMLYIKDTPTSMKNIRARLEDTIHAELEVNSRENKGTIITIHIPKSKKSAAGQNQ